MNTLQSEILAIGIYLIIVMIAYIITTIVYYIEYNRRKKAEQYIYIIAEDDKELRNYESFKKYF